MKVTSALALAAALVTSPVVAATLDLSLLADGPHVGVATVPDAQFSSSTGVTYVNALGVGKDICPFTGVNCAGNLIVAFDRPHNGVSFTAAGDGDGTESPTSLFVTVTTTSGVYDVTSPLDDIFYTFGKTDLGSYTNITGLTIATNDPGGVTFRDFTFAGVPEPRSWALMLAGFGLTGLAIRRRGSASMSGAAAS